MAVYADPPELVLTPDVATPVQDLVESVRTALDVDDAPGTPAAIDRLVTAVLELCPMAADDPEAGIARVD